MPDVRWPQLAATLLSLCTLAASRGTSESTSPLRLRLSDALTIAKTRHLDVLVGSERIQQALAQLGQARSVLFPQVTAAASETRQTRNLEASGITLPGRDPLVGPFNAFDARIRLSQTLFDVTAIERLRAARAGRALSLAEYDRVRQDALALVATLYLDAARAARRLELAHALLTRDAERLRIASARNTNGTGSPLELKQAESVLAQSLHQWHAAGADAIERRLDLTAALGLPTSQPILFIEEEPVEDESLPSQRDVLAHASEHPQVESARTLMRQRRAERAAESAAVLPRVTVNADYGASGKDLGDSEQTYTVGAQVSMPIFEGGLTRARIREADSAVRESEVRLKDAEVHVEANALSAMESVHQARAMVQAAEMALDVSTKTLAIVRHRRQSGLGSDLEVTDALAEAASARDQHDEALTTYRLAQVNLAHATGQMETLTKESRVP